MAPNNYRPTQLPIWFNLSRYDVCASWSAITWGIVLEERAILLDSALYHLNLEVEDDDIDSLPSKPSTLRMLERNPPEENEGPYSKYSKIFRNTSTVAPLGLNDSATIYNEFKYALEGHEDAIFSQTEAKNLLENPSHSNPSSYDESIYRNITQSTNAKISMPYVHLVIQLIVPDDLIIEQFKTFLAEQRIIFNSHSLAKQFTQSDFDEWHKLRLLPFIDLNLWMTITENKLSYQNIGTALFPGEYDVSLADRVRRTTKPKAEWISSSRVIKSLIGQGSACQT